MINPEATKLTMAAVQPTLSYGHVAMGASKPQQIEMRKNLKNSTRFGGTASCVTSTIAFTFGFNADPFIRCPIEQLDLWQQVWLAATGADKQDARFTWHRKIVDHISLGSVGPAAGPVAATVSALSDIGWKSVSPDHWLVDNLTTIKLDAQPFTSLQILTRATRDMRMKTWKRAAEHSHGSGLELGPPSFVAARKAIAYFKKRGLYNAAKAVEYSIVGFFRDPSDDDMTTLAFCHRCGKRKRATRFRIVYECADNENIELDFFEKTKKLVSKATRGLEDRASYWLRGMVPFQQGDGEIAIHEAAVWSTPRFDEVLNESRLGYSDGTRGDSDVPMHIRPAAFGAATFRFGVETGKRHCYDIQCLGGEVPGEQTVLCHARS